MMMFVFTVTCSAFENVIHTTRSQIDWMIPVGCLLTMVGIGTSITIADSGDINHPHTKNGALPLLKNKAGKTKEFYVPNLKKAKCVCLYLFFRPDVDKNRTAHQVMGTSCEHRESILY